MMSSQNGIVMAPPQVVVNKAAKRIVIERKAINRLIPAEKNDQKEIPAVDSVPGIHSTNEELEEGEIDSDIPTTSSANGSSTTTGSNATIQNGDTAAQRKLTALERLKSLNFSVPKSTVNPFTVAKPTAPSKLLLSSIEDQGNGKKTGHSAPPIKRRRELDNAVMKGDQRRMYENLAPYRKSKEENLVNSFNLQSHRRFRPSAPCRSLDKPFPPSRREGSNHCVPWPSSSENTLRVIPADDFIHYPPDCGRREPEISPADEKEKVEEIQPPPTPAVRWDSVHDLSIGTEELDTYSALDLRSVVEYLLEQETELINVHFRFQDQIKNVRRTLDREKQIEQLKRQALITAAKKPVEEKPQRKARRNISIKQDPKVEAEFWIGQAVDQQDDPGSDDAFTEAISKAIREQANARKAHLSQCVSASTGHYHSRSMDTTHDQGSNYDKRPSLSKEKLVTLFRSFFEGVASMSDRSLFQEKASMRRTVGLIAIELLIAGSNIFALFDQWALHESLPQLGLSILLSALNDTCVVLAVGSWEIDGYSQLLIQIREQAFQDDGVLFGRADYWDLLADPYISIKSDPPLTTGGEARHGILALERRVPDRSCLLSGGLLHKELRGGWYNGIMDPNMVLEFINEFCGTYKRMDGELNERGRRRNQIMDNLYSVDRQTDMRKILDHCGEEGTLKSFFYTGQCPGIDLPKCETVDSAVITKELFFTHYLSRSKPFVLKNFLPKMWPRFRDWTNDFFRLHFGRQRVHIKLTPSGEFEGVESASLWNECTSGDSTSHCYPLMDEIPEEVKKHLIFSRHLVMVRPAIADMNMDTFIDIIENRTRWMGYNGSVSAYLEYTPVEEIFVGFKKELSEFPFVKDLLQLDFLNMWLSNGNTLGKLHFDQYDNFLCQVSGKKRVLLFEPHNNSQLYEGHIVEGELAFMDGRFLRHGLMQSTALTMAPVDIEKPDFKTFPNFGYAVPMNCTIEGGDVLFLPSFWWHEVQSYPDTYSRRNLAFNFWYDPFLRKEFPCFDCSLDINPRYRHLLDVFL